MAQGRAWRSGSSDVAMLEGAAITCEPRHDLMTPPRARGAVRLRAKRRGALSVLDGLRMAGSLKVLFPRAQNGLEALLINTAGGITGGDVFDLEATAQTGSTLTLTTQAAERVYRATSGHGTVTTRLQAEAGACLNWLPQELIFFDGGALHRSLHVDLAPDARLLMVEPVVFGRTAMGETVSQGVIQDRITINRANRPLYRDALRFGPRMQHSLHRLAGMNGAGAMACVVYVAPDAEAQLDPVRQHLPQTGGASLLAADVLCLRVVAQDSFDLRRALLPVLERLNHGALPVSWRL